MQVPTFYPLGKDCRGNLILGSVLDDSNCFPLLFVNEGRTYSVYKPYPADVSTSHIKQCMLYEPVSVSSKVLQGSKDEKPLLSVIDLDRRMDNAFMELKLSNPNFTSHDVRRSRRVAIEQYFAENQASYVFESKENPDEN